MRFAGDAYGTREGRDRVNARNAVIVLLLSAVPALGGCGSYVMQGKVVEGSYGAVLIVSAEDTRLDRPGVEGAQLMLYRDPDSLGKKLAARGTSDPDGFLAVEVREFGAGYLDERWLLQVWRSDYQTVEDYVRLPSSKKLRILVMMPSGKSVEPAPMEDLYQLPEQYR